MGKTIIQNFQKRFGNPPRITITSVPLSSQEKEFRDAKIFEIYKQLLTSLLKRPPTEKELLGLVNIEEAVKVATNPPSKNRGRMLCTCKVKGGGDGEIKSFEEMAYRGSNC